MIRFLIRTIGIWILAAAFVALVYDGATMIANGKMAFIKVETIWNALHSTSLPAFQAKIESYGVPWLWDPVATNVLAAPTCLVLGIIGVLLILIGRKRKPLIGYARD